MSATKQGTTMTLFMQLLLLLFIGLKLSGNIDWSWWAVFLPAIIPSVIIFTITFIWAFRAARQRRRGKGGLKV